MATQTDQGPEHKEQPKQRESGREEEGVGRAKSKCHQRMPWRGTKFRNEVMLIASHFVSKRPSHSSGIHWSH